MQEKISAGNDCLRFHRVTGGKLPAPAGNSHEVFFVRVRADFLKPRDVSFYPVPNTLTRVTICCLWSQWWTLQIWICCKKSWTVPCWLFKPLSKKQLAEKVFTTIKNDRELAVVTFSVFSLILSEGNITSKSRSWSWIPIETQCVFDEHYWFFSKKLRIIIKTKNALLFVGEYFLKLSKIQFPRERLNKEYWSAAAGSLLGLSGLKQQKTVGVLFRL